MKMRDTHGSRSYPDSATRGEGEGDGARRYIENISSGRWRENGEHFGNHGVQ